MDARGLIERVRKGDFRGALTVFSRYAPFPGILARICDHPCEPSCRRGEVGEAVRIAAMERACVVYGGAAPAPKRLPSKGKRVAVAGGGLSGLTAAYDLAIKGYDVVVFEAGPRLLGRIREHLPENIIDGELAVLDKLGIEIRCNTRGGDDGILPDFDAIYVGTGPTEQRLAIDPVTYATSQAEIFAGGSHRYAPLPYSPILSVQDGKCAAISIDRFLQGASLSGSRDMQGPSASRLYVNLKGIEAAPAVEPADPELGYSKDEAVREAARCLPCNCLECVKACEYLAYYKAYPKRYVREIYNNDCIVMGVRKSNRMINSCMLCGLCAQVCPTKLNMADACLEARESMVARGHMPPSAHEFALRDMAFSQSSAFALARHQPGFATSEAVFFPGCQLSGSLPEQVYRTYQHLQSAIRGGVGLMLGCCGAAAHWAGRAEQFQDGLASLTGTWKQMGRPKLITACSSCYRTFKDHLPEVEVESLWPVLERSNIPDRDTRMRQTLAIHDPCATRADRDIEDSTRRLAANFGVDIVELNERGCTTCCGYGGLARFANPEVTGKVVSRRIAQSSGDYLTYCAMCRDAFARRGKRALHILELLFSANEGDPAERRDPGFSGRQENRARLKSRFLREVWGEDVNANEPPIQLKISPEVLELMEQRMILVEDVRTVVEHAQSDGALIANPQNGHLLACYRPSCVTYWVEYSVDNGAVTVHNAYSHRMQVL
jgi:Fe-S oxidoreductase